MINRYRRKRTEALARIGAVQPTDQQAPFHDLIEPLVFGFVLRDLLVVVVPPGEECL